MITLCTLTLNANASAKHRTLTLSKEPDRLPTNTKDCHAVAQAQCAFSGMMRPAAPRIMPEKAAGAQRGALVVTDILAFLRCGCNL